MRSLRLVGSPGEDGDSRAGRDDSAEAVDPDGHRVVLESEDGEHFTLAVDDAQRAVLLAALHIEASPPEPGAPEAVAPEPGPTEPGAPEAGTTEPGATDTARTDATRTDATRTEPVSSGPVVPSSAAVEAGVPAQSDPAPPDPRPAKPRTVVALTPREIQVRVRAGEPPEELAEESGMPLDRIMRFASAVLQERSRVGDEARRARARRDGDGGLVPFGETVDRQLAVNGVEAQAVTWDAYRRADGTWVVTAAWSLGGSARKAHWTFALAGRTLLPVDETASDLLSDGPLRALVRAVPDQDTAEPGDAVYDQATSSYTRPRADRQSRSTVADGPLEGGRGTRAGKKAESREADDPRPSAAAPRRTPPAGLRLADPLPDFDDDTLLDDDALADLGGNDKDTAAHPDRATPDRATPDRATPDRAKPETADHGSPPGDAHLFETAETAPETTESAPVVKRGHGRGRAAREQTKIPSWDDILLGVRRRQD